MRIADFRRQCAARVQLPVLMLAVCTIAACSGHAPTRSSMSRHAASATTVREPSGWNGHKSEVQAKRDLAKNDRDSLSASQAGYYLDVLQGRLLQVLGADTTLSRTPERIGIDLAHRVQFGAASPWLDTGGCKLLQPLARALVEFRKTLIVVKVGVDGAGRDAEMLAELRARAAAHCLAISGVASKRIVIVAAQSVGSAPAATAVGGALELDVELVLREAKSGS